MNKKLAFSKLKLPIKNYYWDLNQKLSNHCPNAQATESHTQAKYCLKTIIPNTTLL